MYFAAVFAKKTMFSLRFRGGIQEDYREKAETHSLLSTKYPLVLSWIRTIDGSLIWILQRWCVEDRFVLGN